MNDVKPDKKKRERSKAYPGAPLDTCVDYVIAIKKSLGRGIHDRDSLAKAMGFEKATGGVNPKIAALVYFGWLDRAEGGYQLSSNAQKITDSVSEAEKQEELRQAFRRPTLYQEILEKFESEKQIPTQLSTHLHRFHGITDSASASAAEIFLQSGRFAGCLNADNQIVGKGNLTSTAILPGTRPSQDRDESDKFQPADNSNPADSKQAILPLNSSSQRFEFAISGGRTAVILVPAELIAQDIRIIRKQIELLELQAGIDDPVP